MAFDGFGTALLAGWEGAQREQARGLALQDRTRFQARQDEQDQWEREDRVRDKDREARDDEYEGWRRKAERDDYDAAAGYAELQKKAQAAARAVMLGDVSLAEQMYNEDFPDGQKVKLQFNRDGTITMRHSSGQEATTTPADFLYGKEDGTGMGFLGMFQPEVMSQMQARRQKVGDEKREQERQDARDQRQHGRAIALQDRQQGLNTANTANNPQNWMRGADGNVYRPSPQGMVLVTENQPPGAMGPPAPFRPAEQNPMFGRGGAGGRGGGAPAGSTNPAGNSAYAQQLNAKVQMAIAGDASGQLKSVAQTEDGFWRVAAMIEELEQRTNDRASRLKLAQAMIAESGKGMGAYQSPQDRAKAAEALVRAVEDLAGPSQTQPGIGAPPPPAQGAPPPPAGQEQDYSALWSGG